MKEMEKRYMSLGCVGCRRRSGESRCAPYLFLGGKWQGVKREDVVLWSDSRCLSLCFSKNKHEACTRKLRAEVDSARNRRGEMRKSLGMHAVYEDPKALYRSRSFLVNCCYLAVTTNFREQ